MEVSNASGDQTQVSDEGKKDVVSYETHKKLLAEKKNQQQRLFELEQRLKTFEEKELEQKGQSNELINSLRSRLTEKEETVEKLKTAFQWKQLETAIKLEANRLGCLDTGKLIRLIDSEDLESIEMKDDFSVNSEDLLNVLDKAKKSNPFLFKRIDVNVDDSAPKETKVKQKTLSELSKSELEELIKKQALKR